MRNLELLNEAKGVILKLIVGLLVLFYLSVTGIHMSNGLPIHRALRGAYIDARVALSCPTNIQRIWQVVNRSQQGDDVQKSEMRHGKSYSDFCA